MVTEPKLDKEACDIMWAGQRWYKQNCRSVSWNKDCSSEKYYTKQQGSWNGAVSVGSDHCWTAPLSCTLSCFFPVVSFFLWHVTGLVGLVPQPGMEPVPLAVDARGPNHVRAFHVRPSFVSFASFLLPLFTMNDLVVAPARQRQDPCSEASWPYEQRVTPR